MKRDPITSGKRKSVNLSLDTGVVEAARAAGLNLSQISEAALREAAKKEFALRWREENREAIHAWNQWYERNGHPLEKYRLF